MHSNTVDMKIHRALEEDIVQLNEEECLGPVEEIWQGDIRLQELMKERCSLSRRRCHNSALAHCSMIPKQGPKVQLRTETFSQK